MLETKNKIAQLEQQLREWKQEKKYFDSYFSSSELQYFENNTSLKRLSINSFSESKQLELLTEMTFLDAKQIRFF